MAIARNVVIEQVTGTYDDRITRAIKDSESKTRAAFNSMAAAAKAFVGVLLAREVKQAFRELLNFSREYNTESTKQVQAWDQALIRLKSAVVESGAFRRIVEGIAKAADFTAAALSSAQNFSNVMSALGDVIVVFFKGVAVQVENIFKNAANKILEFQDNLTKFLTAGLASVDFRFKESGSGLGPFGGGLASAQARLDAAIAQGLAGVNTPTRIGEQGPAVAPIETMNVVAIREAESLSTRLLDIKTIELESKLDKEVAYQQALAQLDEEQFQRRQAQAQATAQIFGNLATVAEAFGKKGFAAMKAASMAEAIVNTYAAANVALKSAPPPFNFALAASVVAAGLANVAKIAATSYGSRGIGGGSSGGGGSRRDFGQTQQPAVNNVVNLRLQIGEQVGLAIKEAVEKGLSKDIKLERLAF